ncbi:response regulator [Paucibacter sp. B2R-40]|uniref:response regulator n=1 Tax=Paucibacter sp. B2R-40 TaxID=2893554 RepID=UPI0021E3BFD6|nr:response regulator [Paucibacter sp. B2R-40]MCV2354420.1 response regulator [Paucibacter sp. B2R-40]
MLKRIWALELESRHVSVFTPAGLELGHTAGCRHCTHTDSMSQQANIFFSDEPFAGATSAAPPPWRVLVVDDDEEVHSATRYALRQAVILGRPLSLFHTYSAQATRELLATDRDFAMILLDVVMESERAGLELVAHIREHCGMAACRIILRTGQPGYAPEVNVFNSFDINDYRSKTELGQERLIISLSAALRAYQQIIRCMQAEQQAVESAKALAQMNADLERRVQARTAELALARDAAQAATRAKSEFLANMSHEIRTPMNAIIGMTELALRSLEAGSRDAVSAATKQRRYLATTKLAADALLTIINDILDFSKIEAGHLQLETAEFSLQEMFDRVAAVIGLRAQEKGLELLFDCAPGVPQRVSGDALRLAQVLINLCGNALKFSDSGEIVVLVERLDAPELADAQALRLRLRVRDQGIGMSQAQLATLFQPFQQADNSITRKFGGTGLGLAICKQLVELMGGSFSVQSELGRGSEFSFDVQLGGCAEPAPSELADAGLAGLRVLVIDDSIYSRDILQHRLENLGLQPVLADSARAGIAALQMAQLSGTPFDLLLLDWRMPDMDGLQAAERMQALGLVQPHQIILVTAFDAQALQPSLERLQLAACLAKPVSERSLREAMAQAIGPRPDRAAVHEAAAERLAPDPQEAGLLAALRGRHVLLVEDNDMNQMLACELLQELAGMQVQTAGNGEEALRLLRQQRFDVVLMDVQMPVMDGLQATRLIRQDASLADLPVIAMTAQVMSGDRARCAAAGMNDYVGKPVLAQELFTALAKWLPAAPTQASQAQRAEEALTQRVGLAVLDLDKALAHCQGRGELLDKFLHKFLATRLGDAQQIQVAMQAGDLANAARIAHTAISTAAIIGAERLSAVARELEASLIAEELGEAAREGPADWRFLLQQFEAQLLAVQAALRVACAGR